MLELLQVERELTDIEVDEQLERLSELNAKVDAARKRRDAFQMHYREKIIKADEIFAAETKELQAEIDSLTLKLRHYAEKNITGKRRSMKFPSGTLSFTKQQPQFFIGGLALTNDNPKLIEIARSLDTNLVALKETTRWGELKKRLVIDSDGNVLIKDTGEIVSDIRAKIEPDKFKVETA